MSELLQINSKEFTVTGIQKGESKKNNNRPYVTLNLADEYGNTKTVFRWSDETSHEVLKNMQSFMKGDVIKLVESVALPA